MTHAYHQGLDGYVEGALFQDGCEECETRAKRFSVGHMDLVTWSRARQRALTLNREGLAAASNCEVPVLHTIAEVLLKERERMEASILIVVETDEELAAQQDECEHDWQQRGTHPEYGPIYECGKCRGVTP